MVPKTEAYKGCGGAVVTEHAPLTGLAALRSVGARPVMRLRQSTGYRVGLEVAFTFGEG